MYDKNQIKLGKNIQSRRKAFKESQTELGNAIGKSKTSISYYENGKRKISQNELKAIALRYFCSVDDLMFGDSSNLKGLKNDNQRITREYLGHMFSLVFPIVSSRESLINADFEKAYNLHKEFYETFDENKLSECFEYYQKSVDNNVIEAVANVLGLLICFFGSLEYLTPELYETVEVLNYKSKTIKSLMDYGFLPSLNYVACKKTKEELYHLKSLKNGVFGLNNIELRVLLYRLKESEKYSELGEYYTALSYIFLLENNSVSDNVKIGREMMKSFAMWGNSYAQNFEKFTP